MYKAMSYRLSQTNPITHRLQSGGRRSRRSMLGNEVEGNILRWSQVIPVTCSQLKIVKILLGSPQLLPLVKDEPI